MRELPDKWYCDEKHVIVVGSISSYWLDTDTRYLIVECSYIVF